MTGTAIGGRGLLDLGQRRTRPALVQPRKKPWYTAGVLSDSPASAMAAIVSPGPSCLLGRPWAGSVDAEATPNTLSRLRPPRRWARAGEERPGATVIVRWTTDRTLLAVASPWPRIVADIALTDPTQQWFGPPCSRRQGPSKGRRSATRRDRRCLSPHLEPDVEETELDRPCTLASVNEPARQPGDLEVAAAAFWLDTDLATMLATVKPYDGPDEFVIDDLTDDEWDRFVAALSA